MIKFSFLLIEKQKQCSREANTVKLLNELYH